MSPLPGPVLLALFLTSASRPGEDWNRFRGPLGAGVAAGGARLPAVLDREKNLRWSVEVPAGHSSPCLTDERLFVTGASEHELETVCIERAGGQVLWKRSVRAPAIERHHEVNGPASPTPATDGEHVIACFGSFGLVGFDLDGQELWRRPLAAPKNTFGTAASPVLAGEKLVFLSDSEEGSFVEALEPGTGRTIWRRARDSFKSGWSTPGLWSHAGREELLVLGVGWLTAYDLADGSERWSYPGLTDEPITTPISGADLVFATSYNLRTNVDAMSLWSFERVLAEHDHDGSETIDRTEANENKSLLSRPDADGEGDHPLSMFWRFLDVDQSGAITQEEWKKIVDWVESWEHLNGIVALRPGTQGAELAWHFPRGVPECPSPVFYQERVYMVMNGGTLTCLEAASGKLVYQERLPARGPYYASLVAGDGKFYACSARGEVCVFAAADTLRVLSTTDLGERLMATPALSRDTVYLRTERHVWAFGD